MSMRVEIHYDDGHVERYTGDSILVFTIQPMGQQSRIALGLGGRLDAIGLMQLLTLLEVQLQDKSIIDIAIELWQDYRARMLAEIAACSVPEDKEGQS